MSLALFMKYCKVAYAANLQHFKGAIEKDLTGLFNMQFRKVTQTAKFYT